MNATPENLPAVKEKLKAALAITIAVAETIREAKQISSGHLYAALMPKLDYQAYVSLVNLLKNSGVIREENHLLIWVGGKEDK